MSDRLWVQTFFRGLLVLNLHYVYGFFHDPIHCVIQDETRDLNCSWRSDVRTEHSVLLTSVEEPPCLFTVPLGQNWLVIPRKNLVTLHTYHLTVSGGGKNETHNFTFSDDGYNIILRPPLLSSFILEDGSLEISWNLPDEYLHKPLALRYRILGAEDWMEVDEADRDISMYTLEEPVPHTQYEFQIRYLPDQTNNKGSPWSESHVITSPEMAPNGSLDVWRRVDSGSSLVVMWKELDHRSARGKILAYQVMSGDEETTTEEPCCAKILPAQTTQVCVSARNSKGLGPPSCVAPVCTGMTHSDVFNCTVRGDSKGRIHVSCEDSQRSDNVRSYVLEWRELRESEETELHWMRLQALNETVVLPGPFPSGVPYYLSVYVLYVNSCARIFSTEAYSQEEVPTDAPAFTSHILSNGNVVISWKEVPIQHRKGTIIHHTIYVKSMSRSEHHTVSSRSGNKTLTGLSSATVYTIWMTASTGAGEGPRRILQITAYRHHVFLIVAVVVYILFVGGVVHCFCDCKISFWPKIPKPEDKFKQLFMVSSGNMWQPHQVPINPLIEIVEEIEPPPKPPTPPPPPPPEISPPRSPEPSSPPPKKTPILSSGYEKHFMPTPEEIMCLG